MPYAKGVSAKSYDFDDQGNETTIDYPRMMKIVLDAGYHGYVGIEYEGSKHSEMDGVRLTQKLLERVRDKMAKLVATPKPPVCRRNSTNWTRLFGRGLIAEAPAFLFARLNSLHTSCRAGHSDRTLLTNGNKSTA